MSAGSQSQVGGREDEQKRWKNISIYKKILMADPAPSRIESTDEKMSTENRKTRALAKCKLIQWGKETRAQNCTKKRDLKIRVRARRALFSGSSFWESEFENFQHCLCFLPTKSIRSYYSRMTPHLHTLLKIAELNSTVLFEYVFYSWYQLYTKYHILHLQIYLIPSVVELGKLCCMTIETSKEIYSLSLHVI